MYRSIHEKLLTLPDDTEIFPAHGAGSLCGRQMSSESSSTIGKQRQSNYALLARTSEEFVHLLTDNLPARPEYFAREVDLNRRGAAPLSDLPPLAALTAPEVLRLQKEGAVVVDTRPAMQFAVAHVPGSVHIALTGQYASWAARILGLDTPPDHCRQRIPNTCASRRCVSRASESRIWSDTLRMAWPAGLRAASSWTISPRSQFRISSNCGIRNRTESPYWTYASPEK